VHTGCGKLRSCCGSALGSPMRLSFVRVTMACRYSPTPSLTIGIGKIATTNLSRIRFHDLRYAHATHMLAPANGHVLPNM